METVTMERTKGYPKFAVQVLSFLENKEKSIMFKNEQLNW
jgi:hypothetical protein